MIKFFATRSGFAKREAIDAYKAGVLAVHRSLDNPQFWIVSHPDSGMSVTGGRRFDSKAQAMRFANEMQKHLDFSKLTETSGVWDVQKAFGSEGIRRAMSSAFQEAYGS